MNEKENPLAPELKTESDQAAFEKLPQETQELMKLKQREEKTIGTEQMEVTSKIKTKSRP